MFIIIVFRLGSDKHVYCLINGLSTRDQSRDVTPLVEGGWFFIFDCLSSFYFLLIEFHYIVLHILYSADMLCLLFLYVYDLV